MIQPIDEQATPGVANGALPTPNSIKPPTGMAPGAKLPGAMPDATIQSTPPAATPPALPSPSSVTPAAPAAAAPALPNPAPPLTNPGGTVPTTPIDPNNDLRSSAVLPTSSPALDTARSTLTGATGALTGYDRNADVGAQRADLSQFFGPTDVQAGAAVGTAPSARLGAYNTMLDSSAGNLASVDRVKLAKDALAQFDDAQLPEHDLALRKLTEQYVARGGGKSGMVRTAYGNEDLTRQRDRDLMKQKLITAATEGSIQDAFNKTNALSGLQSATSAQDAAARGEQRTDRGYATDVATGNVERGLSAKLAANAGANTAADSNRAAKTTGLAAAGDLFNTLSNEGAANRSETRGERAYQGSQEDTSYKRGMTQLETEQQQKTADLNRQIALLGAGEGGNPAGTLTSLANGQPGLDANLIASLGASLGKKANSGTSELDKLLASLNLPPAAVPGQQQQAVPVAAGNDPAYEY